MVRPPKVEEKNRRGHQSQGPYREWDWRLYIPMHSSSSLHIWLMKVDSGKPLLSSWSGPCRKPIDFYSHLAPLWNNACPTADANTWEAHLYTVVKKNKGARINKSLGTGGSLPKVSKWNKALFWETGKTENMKGMKETFILHNDFIFEVL